MQFFNDILSHYSWQGTALIGAIILLFVVQFYYYAIRYNRIPRYRLLRRKKITIDNPPISIIVVVRGENEHFLTDECMALLSQEYECFEVVVVYVGGDLDYYAELQRIKEQHSNMRLTKMGGNDRLYITTKQALNVGIKSAQYDNLLFTTTGSHPISNEWVSLMAKGFERNKIVIGPELPEFESDSARCYLMRMTEFHRERNAMAAAVSGKLYYAPRSNFGFTRELYEMTRGFTHLNLDSGENDLYLQTLVRYARPAAVLARRSAVAEKRDSSWHEWLETMRYNSITRHYYPASVHQSSRREFGSRILFFLCTIVALIIMPSEVKIGVAALLLLRYMIVVWSTRRTAHKLGERGIVMRYWMFDIAGPFIEYIISLKRHDGKAKVWR